MLALSTASIVIGSTLRLRNVNWITLLLQHAALLVYARKEYIFFGVGGHATDLVWIDKQNELYGHVYKPIFINPQSGLGNLSDVLKARGGVLYPNAAWTADDLPMKFHMTLDTRAKGGLDGVFHENSKHVAHVNVTTVDIARLFMKHTASEDVVVMRMDAEGAEYELLRHLLVKGLLCRLSRLYLEAHAMTIYTLNHFRTFDVLLPWLLEPCGTEVYIDSNYHSVYEAQAIWVKDDGACRDCPLLYAPLPGSGTVCPSSALPHCFDEEFTCENCCSISESGPRGNSTCWSRAAKGKDSIMLPSGGRAYPIPDDVLAKIGARSTNWRRLAENAAGKPAGRPPVFSYEMCCAGMLGRILPELNVLVAQQGENEVYQVTDPRFVRAVGDVNMTTSCGNFRGTYVDSGGGSVHITQTECRVMAKNSFQRWQVAGLALQEKLQLWNLEGTLFEGSLSWSNGAIWTRSSS